MTRSSISESACTTSIIHDNECVYQDVLRALCLTGSFHDFEPDGLPVGVDDDTRRIRSNGLCPLAKILVQVDIPKPPSLLRIILKARVKSIVEKLREEIEEREEPHVRFQTGVMKASTT